MLGDQQLNVYYMKLNFLEEPKQTSTLLSLESIKRWLTYKGNAAKIALVEEIMDSREKCKLAASISNYIFATLIICPGPQSKKLVLQRVLSNPKIQPNLLNHILPTKIAIAQQEVLVGINKSIKEVRRSNSNVELASKHCLISASINVGPSSSVTRIARVLNIHPRNIFDAYERRRLISDLGIPLWSLSIKKNKIDGCTTVVKKAAICWWASNTRFSPNKFDVTRKHLEVGVYDEKPTHFPIKTHVL
jgi:hypothetical protein